LLSGVAFDGIVTVVGPKSPAPEPVEFAYVVIDDTGVLCSVKVIDSPGSKLVPLTKKDPPSTEHPSLTVIPTPTGAYWGGGVPNAAVDHPKLSPKPTTAERIATLRLMARSLSPFASGIRLWSQRRSLTDTRFTWANVTLTSEM
jgi:hypothetical protein